jgi:hypothetical protein
MTVTADFIIGEWLLRAGDRLPILGLALESDTGEPLDLTDARATLMLRHQDGLDALTIEHPGLEIRDGWLMLPAFIYDAPNGVVVYDWPSDETESLRVGVLELMVEVLWPATNERVIVPSMRDARLVVRPSAIPEGPPGPPGPPGPEGPPGPPGADGVGVPAGGTTGQVLGKASNANYATAWIDQTGGGGGGTGDVPSTRRIDTTPPLQGGGDFSANRALSIDTFTTSVKGAVPPPGTVDLTKFLRTDGTWVAPTGSGGGTFSAEDAVDAVAAALTPGSGITTAYNDPANTITISATNIPTANVIGLDTALAGKQPLDPDLTTIAGLSAPSDNVIQSVSGAWASRTPTQLTGTLLPFSTSTTAQGVVPGANGAGATAFLNAAGAWAVPSAGSVADNSINNFKLANMPALTLKGNNTGVSDDPADLTAAQAKTLLGVTKADVGLGNVDNTSNATERAATATLTNKTINLANNTLAGTLSQFNTAITDADVPAALNGLTGVWMGTQAQYDAIGTKTSTVVYMVTA